MILSRTFQNLKEQGEKAFVAYLTAGDPTTKATFRYVRTLSRAGATVIELGVPHSDPVADGPTNAMAAERALKNNTSLSDVLNLVRDLREEGEKVPLVLFTYLNPILRMGIAAFAKRAQECGVSGVLVVDLPPEEATSYIAELKAKSVETVFLCSPTTTRERLSKIAESSSGFVYYVSRTGVTGVQSQLSLSLQNKVNELKRFIEKPICVGFGVSTAQHVSEVLQVADGVVVGSCFVDIIASSTSIDETDLLLEKKMKELRQGIPEINKGKTQC